MAAKKSPLAQQKDEFGSKEKLVDRLVTVLGQITKLEGDKDDLKAKLLAASNKKLLRLFEVGAEIKEKFGSVEKLADGTAQALGRAKDLPYVAKLKTLTPAKLLDLFHAAEKRGRRKRSAA
jgi:hypothetical protein